MRQFALRGWAAVAIALAVCAAVEVVRSLQDARTDMGGLLWSDTLWPAALYQSVVVDRYQLDHFQFSAATFAFPDLTLYCRVRAAVGQTGPAVLAWMWALFGVMALAGWLAGRAILPGAARAYYFPILLSWVSAYVGFVACRFSRPPSDLLIRPVCHTGALGCGLSGLVLTISFLRARTRTGRAGWLFGLAVLCGVAVFSDRLFGLYFVAPLGISVLVMAAGRPAYGLFAALTRARAAGVVAAVGVGCAAGLMALRAVQSGDDPLEGYWNGAVWTGLGVRATGFAGVVGREFTSGNLLVVMTAGWYTACLASAVTRRRSPPDRTNDPTPFAFYQLFSMATLTAVAGVFLLSRTSGDLLAHKHWDDYARYFVGPIGLAFFGWPIWITLLVRRAAPPPVRAITAAAPVVLAALAVGANWVAPKSRHHDLTDPAPEYVRRVDEACVRYSVRDGLSDVWTSGAITLLSRSGVRAHPVAPATGAPFGVQVFPWLSNAEGYWNCPAGSDREKRYEYVLAADRPGHGDELWTHAVIRVFGEPAARVPVGGRTLLVYNRPTDTRLHRYHRLDPSVLNLRHRLSPREPVRYPGDAFSKFGTPRVGPSGEVAAAEGAQPAGLLTNGPYVRPRLPGRYRATFRVSSSGTAVPNGMVAVVLVPTGGRPPTPLTTREVPPGFDGELPIEFEVTRSMSNGMLDFHTVYHGRGSLTLQWVDFELR